MKHIIILELLCRSFLYVSAEVSVGDPTSGHSVVHKEGIHSFRTPSLSSDTSILGPKASEPLGIVQVEHGIPVNSPKVVHRQATHIGPRTDTHIDNVRVDMSGKHGNPVDSQPVIHREATHLEPRAGILIGNVHVDMPREQGTPIDGIPLIHREPSLLGLFKGRKNHPGGNGLNEPALHLPPGATIEDARRAGIIPGPVVLGADNDFDRTNFEDVGGRSVLLSRGSRRRGGRRKGRRRGRGRGRGRWRGGRRRTKTTTTTTATVTTTTVTTTTTTTPAPKKSRKGSGLTIIKTSRPSPLAAFGNALKSVLNVRNSGRGGLLGSLFRSGLFRGKR